ncbi:hypothetical protein TrispH2_010964 [Trichoplax sp. H2]|uniref:Expressed protein n=1 Tax=Trichoplax adhaerens TaxID=10228 RepID=B3SA64_TRIAD|nr:expressed protein [Trichoplax adhaerens]EDV20380.1 expressed protein [Trichoplax adhaerens]RDD37627.1 hypothetical protein TrispH2_010964 [Trichoplax sp. H2]|eukprot:XP_002117074.1 expressed protein [Trichoplax adhaerens]
MAFQFKFITVIAILLGLSAVIDASDFIIFNENPISFLDCSTQRNQVLTYWDECNLQVPFDDCPLKKRRSISDFDLDTENNQARYTKFGSELTAGRGSADSFLKFGHPMYARLAPLNLERLDEKCCMPAPNPPAQCLALPSLCPAGSSYDESTYEQMVIGGCEIFIEENL